MANPLDQLPEFKGAIEQDNEVVKAAKALLIDANEIKNEKEQTVERAEEYLTKLLSGEDPQRVDQFISYLPLIVVNIFTTLYKVPDLRVVRTGYSEDIETLMSAFLEKVITDGGFVEMMEEGFGGAYQAAAYGDFYVLGQTGIIDKPNKKIKKGEPYVQYQGLSVGNAFFNKEATSIRTTYVSQDLSTFGVIDEMSPFEAERMFPGIMEYAMVGRIPSSETEDNPTSRKTDIQDSYDENLIEILYFYDKYHKVFSIIAGANAYEYNRIEGKDFEKAFKMIFKGKDQVVLPIGNFGLEPRPQGIYHSGIFETFNRLIDLDTQLSTSLANNVLESNYSPEIWNIENVDSAGLLEQIRRGKIQRQEGKRPVIIPESSSNQPVGRAQVEYMRPNELSGENESLEVKIQTVFRRLGYDVDFNFTDSTKTLGQSEIDISRTTGKVSQIQSQNRDFYQFVYWYAIDKIIKLGNENNDTIFGSDVEIDINGEIFTAEDILNKPLTEGDMVKLFKDARDRMDLEIDLKNGFVFNDTLERRAAERELANTAPGSPANLRALRRLSVINRGGKIKMSDIIGTGGELPQPQAQQLATADQL